jgi:hypothetical protein
MRIRRRGSRRTGACGLLGRPASASAHGADVSARRTE